MGKGKDNRITEIRNRKANHEYFVGETFEAGIVLTGTEIKSLRAGKNDAFVRVDNGEAVMYQSHISEYDFGNINNHNPARPRKLLLHKKEILKLKAATDSGGTAIIPLKIYFKKAQARRYKKAGGNARGPQGVGHKIPAAVLSGGANFIYARKRPWGRCKDEIPNVGAEAYEDIKQRIGI